MRSHACSGKNVFLVLCLCLCAGLLWAESTLEPVAPGVWKMRCGTPEAVTPVALRSIPIQAEGLQALERVEQPPFEAAAIGFANTARGCSLFLPMQKQEKIFGFGLQLTGPVEQTGKKRTIRINSDPKMATGDSHAPAPFYLSTAGYGVYVDTARYATFYTGTHEAPKRPKGVVQAAGAETLSADNTADLYSMREIKEKAVVVDIPAAEGVDVYLFAGPSLKLALQRYVLFSGGGCAVPMWGMGVMYRSKGDFSAEAALHLAQEFREREMPCDVFGLEPGWQTHVYSCSYKWSPKRFPDPDAFLASMTEMGFRVNLWEHIFTHPTSPIYEALYPYAGDVAVWGGLVPDLTMPEARDVFAKYHDETLIAKGVSAFKCDECDNSDFKDTPWSFPEYSRFPSGVDGEQLHSLLGCLYQQTLHEVFKKHNRRSYGQVRSSHALAAPYPFALYSDLYAHRDFVQGVATCGLGGMLWTPELRHAGSVEDLLRRVQVLTFSPQTLVNAWYIKNPPWKQVSRDPNNRDEFMDGWEETEAQVKALFETRMQLLPYLYSAFMIGYRQQGIPPFRGLMVDYPDDPACYVDDAYMMGDSLLVAPLFAGESGRKVYLPKGGWYDFWTHAYYEGGKSYDFSRDHKTIPVFVKEGSILPLAEAVTHVAADTVFNVTVYSFGKTCRDRVLWEDDGESYDFESGAAREIRLSYSAATGPAVQAQGSFTGKRYEVIGWEHIVHGE